MEQGCQIIDEKIPQNTKISEVRRKNPMFATH